MPATRSLHHCRWYRWRDDFPGIDEGTGVLAASSTWVPLTKRKNSTLRRFTASGGVGLEYASTGQWERAVMSHERLFGGLAYNFSVS